jgi:hypothetical protein
MDPNTPTVTFDRNVYYSPAGAAAVKWSLDGKDYSSFQEYVKATGEDRDSKFADPEFVDPAATTSICKRILPRLAAASIWVRTSWEARTWTATQDARMARSM